MTTKQLYLVGVDGSECSRRAADFAVQLARHTGAVVRLIAVVVWSGNPPLTQDEKGHRLLEKEERVAQEQHLGPILEKHKDSDVEISGKSFWGNPAKIIRRIAKRDRANQVFVGQRGRSPIADLILGKVANKLSHGLGIPIVLVP